jgi:hypothetical protein
VEQIRKRKGNLAINDLGFESHRSLYMALGTEQGTVDQVLDLCQNGYPYECWYEPKRSGNGHRLIENPHSELKGLQKRVNRLLQRLNLPPVFHGCYSGTSILTNAEQHVVPSWFLTFDLANYFKTIRPRKVYDSLRSLGAAPKVARVLTRLTTIKGRVPQGAPTSPIIAAIAMLALASRLQRLCEIIEAICTVYGDNICLSGGVALVRHKNTILGAARSEGFRVRADKTLIRKPGEDKPLPGLIIRGGHPTVSDEDLSTVTRLLDACLALGPCGLARKVCPRFTYKLRGIVNHYSWIDEEAMRSNCARHIAVRWPGEYRREPCLSLKCHCTPLRGVSAEPPRIGYCGVS